MSYTRSMEKTLVNTPEQTTGILLSAAEAEEYRNFKRRKYIQAVTENIAKATLDLTEVTEPSELGKLCAVARKYSLAAVRVTPNKLSVVKAALAESKTLADAFVGGTGKTLPKAKAYEAKLCVRGGAGEITLMPDESVLNGERLSELKKEIKKTLRKAGRVPVKLFLKEKRGLPELFRLSKLLSELGAGLSVPYFSGVERLKLDDKTPCFIEVREVETAELYQKMAGAGMDRIQTSRILEIYAELMQQAENYSFPAPLEAPKNSPKTPRENPPAGETEAIKEETPKVAPLEKAKNYRALIEEYQNR